MDLIRIGFEDASVKLNEDKKFESKVLFQLRTVFNRETILY